MPTATYIALANTTLSATAATVTFSSIPNTYRDLVLVANFTPPDNTTSIYTRINSDTGSNYSIVIMSGNSSTGAASTSTTTTNMQLGIVYVGSGERQNLIANYMDYSATDKHKTVLARAGHTSETITTAGRWANTNAITSITISGNANFTSNSFLLGSTFALYGIVS